MLTAGAGMKHREAVPLMTSRARMVEMAERGNEHRSQYFWNRANEKPRPAAISVIPPPA